MPGGRASREPRDLETYVPPQGTLSWPTDITPAPMTLSYQEWGGRAQEGGWETPKSPRPLPHVTATRSKESS